MAGKRPGQAERAFTQTRRNLVEEPCEVLAIVFFAGKFGLGRIV